MRDPLLALALVLAAAEAGGLLSTWLGLPRVTGQIAAGVLLGPSVFGLVHDGATIGLLAEIGALSILAVAGLETDLHSLRSVGRPALLAAIGGVALPFVGGTAATLLFTHDVRSALFAGAVLTATSVGITAPVLRELGLFDTRAGATIMGAAVVDDVLGLVVLGLVIAEVGAGGSPLPALGGMAAVLVVSALGAWKLRNPLTRLFHYLESVGGGLAALVALVLVVGWAYQNLGGLAGITGAYVAGLAFAGTPIGAELKVRLEHAGDAITVPIFFVAIGLSADIRTLAPVAGLAVVLLAVATLGKLLGSGIGAAVGGLDRSGSATVGIGMIARGEVALIAASVGAAAGAIDAGMFAALVLVALATTIITPVGLAWYARVRHAIGEPARTGSEPVRTSSEPARTSGQRAVVPQIVGGHAQRVGVAPMLGDVE